MQKRENMQQLADCVRCRMQQVTCVLDPTDPQKLCDRCRKNTSIQDPLPCLRYGMNDVVLYRPGSSLPVYRDFDFTGPNAGVLPHAERLTGSIEWILLAQADQSPMKIAVCRFEISASHLDAVPSHQKPLYEHPYMLADASQAAAANLEYVERYAQSLASTGVGTPGDICWRVFDAAFKMAGSDSSTLPHDVIRLWSSCRLMEGGWHILGENNLQFQADEYGHVVPSLLLNAQLHAVEATKIIGPLTESVMRRLEDLVRANKKDHFYEIFLCMFILLHNYEKMVARQRSVAIKRKAKVLYTNMPYIRAMQDGSKALLACFHYDCKGSMLFQPDFDLASLNEEQRSLFEAVRVFGTANQEHLTPLSHTDQYDQPYWFISQLFDTAWQPRSTWEHSPEV